MLNNDRCLEVLAVHEGATPMFFIVAAVPLNNGQSITDAVDIETFIDLDELPAKTTGTMKFSTKEHAHFICFRQPLMAEDGNELTVNVTCGSMLASRKIPLRQEANKD